MPDDDHEGQQEGGDNPVIRELREKAAKADEALRANAQMQRELAMLKSGIDTEHPLGQFFAKNYDGDPADVEAMKQAATALGVPFKVAQAAAQPEGQPSGQPEGSQPEGQPEGSTMPTEDHGTRERQALSRGAPADDGGSGTPRAEGIKMAQTALEQGASFEEASGGLVAHLARAAHAGDPRVIVPPKAIRDVPRL